MNMKQYNIKLYHCYKPKRLKRYVIIQPNNALYLNI